jgi:hypothetical protein
MVFAEDFHNISHLVEELAKNGVFHKADYIRVVIKSKR